MTKEQLKQRIDTIIAIAGDDEVAHAEEDELHVDVIKEFCPQWVTEEIQRLSDTDFARWCA